MRRAKPNHGEERSIFLGADKLERFGHGDFGGISFKILKLTVAAHDRMQVEKVGDRNPRIKSEDTRMQRILLKDRCSRTTKAVEVPFTKVASGVTRIPHRLRDGLFLSAQRITVSLHARAIVTSACQQGGPGGRAIRGTRVESIKPNTRRRHLIQMRRLQQRMTVIASLAPALVI